MVQKKSKPTELTLRREKVAARYIQGQSQHEIATAFGISQTTVSRDLDAIRESWKQSAIRDYGLAVAKELAKVDRIERRAWDAWEKSLRPRVTVSNEKNALGDKRRKVVEGQSGNPSHLQIVLQCVERRCQLLGLYEAKGLGGIEGTALTPDQEAAAMDATVPAGPGEDDSAYLDVAADPDQTTETDPAAGQGAL